MQDEIVYRKFPYATMQDEILIPVSVAFQRMFLICFYYILSHKKRTKQKPKYFTVSDNCAFYDGPRKFKIFSEISFY